MRKEIIRSFRVIILQTHHSIQRVLRFCGCILILLLFTSISFSQSRLDSLFNKLNPHRYASIVEDVTGRLEDKLVKKTQNALTRMEKLERKLYKGMLKGKDSVLAQKNLLELKIKYGSLKKEFGNPRSSIGSKVYIPELDSLTTSLKFLDGNGVGEKLKDALSRTNSLTTRFNQAEEIKKFLRERKEQLKQQFEKLGIAKELKRINKQVYYYSAQLNEYRAILRDPKRIQRKALDLLSKSKKFQEFMKKNCLFASLFRMSGDPADPNYLASLAGLQTRSQITNLVQQQISRSGGGGQQQFTQSLQTAQTQLNELKNKVLGSGGGSSDYDMPDFKPNSQKTKSFFKRFEYGTNIQTGKASNFFPATADLAISAGYKLNDRSVIGIGASYKLGIGRGWNNINLSHQGIGIRSFADIKLKGSIWISGGYERNHKSAFDDFVELRERNAWQKSGLIGLSKVLSLKTKLFKKTNIKLLWDFLSYQQIPRTQPVVFRVGYNF